MNKQIADLINSLGNQIKGSEQIITSSLSNKLKKCASLYPQDKTIGALSVVVQALSKNNIAITKKAFKDLYDKHYTNGTIAANLFSDELGVQIEKEASIQPKKYAPVEINPNSHKALQNVISSTIFKESKASIDSNIIKQAEIKVAKDLSLPNFKPKSVKAIDSNSEAIVVVASYESPKGLTDIFVPVTKSLEGNVFVGNNIVKEITADNLKEYILKNAGNKLSISSKKVLNIIESKTMPEQSKTELAAVALKIKNAQVAVDGILAYKLPENKETIVELPKSGEFRTLEEKFASPWGIALENFGERVLQRAASVVQTTLNQINSPAQKINLVKSADTTLVFSVLSKSGKSFTVPVKVSGGNCISPEIAFIDGSIAKLDKTFENKLSSSNLDKNSFTHVANLAVLSPIQLISVAKEFSKSKELDKLAATLDVLREKDLDMYKNAYKLILGDFNKQACENGCKHLVKRANSLYQVCSQTNLPENKVYQDKDGNCRPLYRKDLDNNFEGAFYMTSKILG